MSIYIYMVFPTLILFGQSQLKKHNLGNNYIYIYIYIYIYKIFFGCVFFFLRVKIKL